MSASTFSHTRPLSRYCAYGALKARAKSERCDECARALRKKERPVCACGCGATVARPTGYTYASVACLKNVEYREWVARWLAGEEHGNVGETTISNHVRRWLIDTRSEKCEECGWDKIHPKTGKVPLTVHHKDGDGFNNRPENLSILCPNCHSLTENFAGLNRGNGRKARGGKRA